MQDLDWFKLEEKGAPDQYMVVSEFMEGGSLLDMILSKGKLSEHQTRLIVHQLLLAVSHAHSKGITHGDITLDNVLFESRHPSPDFVVKLTGFRYA